jgi:hypothetical protein
MFEKDEVFVIPENSLEDKTLQGQGKQRLLIIVDDLYFGDSEEETLRKLVAAIGYEYLVDNVLWRWRTDQNVSVGLLHVPYNDIILFGITPDQIGIFVQYKLYALQLFEQKRLLVSDGIRDINSHPAKKQVLWNMLKQMFLSK